MSNHKLSENKKFILNENWNYDNGKITIIFLYFSLYAVAAFAYKNYLIIYWQYYGFSWNLNIVKLVESLLLLLILAIFLPSKSRKPSDFLVHLQMLLPILPMLVMYGISNQNRTYIYSVSFALLIVLLIKNYSFNLPLRGSIKSTSLMRSCIAIGYLNIASIIALGGYKYLNFDLLAVYDYRNEAASNLPTIYGYLSPTVSKIILPFALVIALIQKKHLYVLLAILGSILMFGLTSHKGPLFYPFFVIFLYYISKNRKMIVWQLSGFFTVLFSTTVYAIYSGNTFLPSLIIRRMLFVPAGANFGYHHYFSSHPHIYLGSSKVTFGLVDYPYDLTPPLLIGKEYWGTEVSANTGWIGTAYMHFDYYGLVIFAVVVGLLLGMVDNLSDKTNKSLVTAVVTVPFFSLFVSTDLPTAVLTHGILVAILLVWIMSKTSLLDGNPKSATRQVKHH